jgi:hypothetical protein
MIPPVGDLRGFIITVSARCRYRNAAAAGTRNRAIASIAKILRQHYFLPESGIPGVRSVPPEEAVAAIAGLASNAPWFAEKMKQRVCRC